MLQNIKCVVVGDGAVGMFITSYNIHHTTILQILYCHGIRDHITCVISLI